MSENNNMEDRIDKYLLGQMSEEERSTFEKELSADDILKQEVEAAALVSSSVCRNKVKDILQQAEAEYQLEMEERIDTYIMGRMSPSEAIEFEMELKENTSLKEKYDAQKQVASAVKRLQLKALMEEAEAEIAAEPERESIFKRIFGSIEIKFEVPAVRRAAYSFAVAASLALVAGIGFDMQQTSVYRNSAEGLMAELSQARGGSDIDDLMILCNADITSKNESKVARLRSNFELVKRKLVEVEEKDALRNFKNPISGDYVMQVYGIPPCSEIGRLKDMVKEAILDGQIGNNFEEADALMRELAPQLGLKEQ